MDPDEIWQEVNMHASIDGVRLSIAV